MFPQDVKPSHVDLEAEKLTNNEIRAAIRHLREGVQSWVDVYGEEHSEYPIIPFDNGYYRCYLHPLQEADLVADPNITTIFQYAVTPSSAMHSAVPGVYGCEFYRTRDQVEIEDDDFVVVTGSTFGEPDERFTAVFKGVKNNDSPH